MKVLQVICGVILFLSPTTLSSWSTIFDFSTKTTQELCDLGCECPPQGQSYIFLNCGLKSLNRLPSNINFHSSISRVSFQGNKLSNLSKGSFYSANKVEELDLSLNNLRDIQDSVFTGFTSLAVLSLSHNSLITIRRGLLNGLSNLRVLTLGNNRLDDLQGNIFQPTPNLRELRLRYNNLKNLREDTFNWLPRLERLDLEATGLTSLSPRAFVPNPNLQWLSLSSNRMIHVPSEALRKATNLSSLDLSGNAFATLPSKSFASMPSILHLNMNNLPRLASIEKDAFSGLSNLKSLSCSYNDKLKYVHPEAFGINASIPHEQLYLNHNRIRSLPANLTSWEKKTYVDLRDNPWNCDCKLQWMLNLKWEMKSTIKCEGPAELKERFLSTVLSDDMTCSLWLFSTVILVIGAIVVFIMCMVAAAIAFCPRSTMGLYIKSHHQFKYNNIVSHKESVDLEWDHSAEM